MKGLASDSTSRQPAPSCSAILWFLSLWLRKHPQDFCDYPDMATVKRLVDYIRLNAPSTEVAMQTEELLSMLEEQESKPGEEAWGRCLGRQEVVSVMGCTRELSRCPGLEPELDPCPVRRTVVGRGGWGFSDMNRPGVTSKAISGKLAPS